MKASSTIFFALAAAAAGTLVWAILLIARAPVEATMGIVQKVFYFHVPSATAMYFGVGACALGGAVYLFRESDRWDAVAFAGGQLAVLFSAIVLITGPLWARKAWGVYWTWDPRLTTTLLLFLMYTAYLLVRSLGGAGRAERRFAAALGVFAAVDAPIVHWSVARWRGHHPRVISAAGMGGGGLDPDMRMPLLVSIIAFSLLFAALFLWSYRLERDRQRLAALRVRAAERGLA